MLARLVIARRAALFLQQACKQPHLQHVHPPSSITARKVLPWANTRAFSTPPQSNKEDQSKQQDTQDNTNEKEEGKEEGNTEKEGTEKEGEEKKEDIETPIEEPGWKTTRAGTFQAQKEGKQVTKEFAILFWLLGLGGFSIGAYQVYKTFTTQYKEGQVDPGQLFRKVLEKSIKDITTNQKAIDTFFKSPSVVEEGMAQCQMFGHVTTLSFPLLQPNTAARLGTVYVDLLREEDTYEIKSAYVDSVYGKTLDLIAEGIITAEKYDLFDSEFSAQKSMEQMQQAHEELMRAQAMAEQAKAAQALQRVLYLPSPPLALLLCSIPSSILQLPPSHFVPSFSHPSSPILFSLIVQR